MDFQGVHGWSNQLIRTMYRRFQLPLVGSHFQGWALRIPLSVHKESTKISFFELHGWKDLVHKQHHLFACCIKDLFGQQKKHVEGLGRSRKLIMATWHPLVRQKTIATVLKLICFVSEIHREQQLNQLLDINRNSLNLELTWDVYSTKKYHN